MAFNGGITAKDWELLSCFGVEPQLAESDVPWADNDALYVVELGEISLSCAIHPSYRDVRLMVHLGGKRIYELNAMDVSDILVPDAPGGDILEIRLSHREWLRVQLRPSFQITQGFELKTWRT